MTKYEIFSHVNTREQAEEVRDNLQKLGFKCYYKYEWIIMREVKE